MKLDNSMKIFLNGNDLNKTEVDQNVGQLLEKKVKGRYLCLFHCVSRQVPKVDIFVFFYVREKDRGIYLFMTCEKDKGRYFRLFL